MKCRRAIGLMSGTSMDGIDVAMVETDGIRIEKRGPYISVPYEPAFRSKIEAGLSDALAIGERSERPGNLYAIETELTDRHEAAVADFLRTHEIDRATIDVVGFHGQTVLHRPEIGLTVQLGDGARLAGQTGIPVISDMRANDMRYGGQGAPLVPIYHAALRTGLPAQFADRWGPVAFVNIGGIANVTFVNVGKPPVAFDCGPGNALIDQWLQQEAGVPYDDGGLIAGEGTVDELVASRYMAAPFFSKDWPKSLDRNDFTLEHMGGMDLSDGAATLARITALSIIRAAEKLPARPELWIVSGGGALNAAIMDNFRVAAGLRSRVITADEAGFNPDMMEAEAWAYLAVRALHALPITFPTTTGCTKPVSGGVLARPGAT